MAKPEPLDPELGKRVLGLRRAGVQFDVIATELGCTPETAKAAFNQALAAYEPGLLQALEADRLDRLHVAVWSKAVAGDLDAVDRVLKISERRDKVLADPRPNKHELTTAYDEAVTTSEHIEDVDKALVQTGRQIAVRVDQAVANGEGVEVTRALYLLPHMVNVLRELMATPAARIGAGLVQQPAKEGKLAQLRAIQRDQGRTG